MAKTGISVLLFTLSLWPLAISPAFAAFSDKDAGTSGAQFLKIGPGARPAGMGEAFSAVADDLHALYYNPAGLSRINHVLVGGMHNQYFQGLDYNFGALAVPLSRFKHKLDEVTPENSGGVLGLAVYSLAAQDLERRGLNDTDMPTGIFDASDSAYALSYARPLSERIAVGGTAKMIAQKIDNKNASSFAFDAGGLYRKGPYTASLGLRNLGTSPKFSNESDPLPFSFYLGGSYRLFKERLALAMDVNLPRDNKPNIALGTEYKHPFTAAFNASLRAGYFTRNTDPGGLSGLSMGAGLGFKNLAFDFAWVPFGDLGNTFRYSFLLRF